MSTVIQDLISFYFKLGRIKKEANVRYLCAKADGIASGNKDSVIPRSLMERLMMKNSAGFKVDLLWYATSSRILFPVRERIPVTDRKD